VFKQCTLASVSMHIFFVERRSFDVDAFSISQHAHQGVATCLEVMVNKGVHIDQRVQARSTRARFATTQPAILLVMACHALVLQSVYRAVSQAAAAWLRVLASSSKV
jgi:hypothetical protein